jgi:hypothetical protein
MPKGPRGRKRPADVVSNAVLVMKIATGEVEDTPTTSKGVAGGLRGGRARAKVLTPEQRRDIAQVAASARWKKSR